MVSVDQSTPGVPRRARGERGAALVEFAISIVLLLTLLFGIISYGYMLSFKQGLTQAAAEGARAGAVAASGSEVSAATAAATRSVGAFNKACNATPSVGLTCTYTLSATTPKTVTVQLTYNYKTYPLLPKFPGLGLILPDTLKSTYIAEVN